MSLYNDYNIQIFHDEKLAGFRAETANDRLARIANGARRPWWRRLLDGRERPHQDNTTVARVARGDGSPPWTQDHTSARA